MIENENMHIFTESSEELGIMFNSYKGLYKIIGDFLDLAKDSIDSLLKNPTKVKIDLKSDIDKFKKDIDKKLAKIGKKAINGQRLVELLYCEPKVNGKTVAQKLGISIVSANGLLKAFVEIGILEEKTGFNRNRYYVFEEYVKIFR